VKRVLVIAVLVPVVAALAVTGLILGGSAQAAPAPSAVSPSQTVVFDCLGRHALARPKSIILTCADGNAYFAKLAWTSWKPGLASATGTLVLNDCTPYCAAGHFHRYPAIVVLWGSKAVPGRPGEHCYTKLTEILTGQRPRYYDAVHRKWVTAPMTQTMPLLTSSHEA
jgi:hypothetical protein